MMIATVEKLEAALSDPVQADIEAMRELDGDLLILGVGGKMGPSLAKLARRAAEAGGTRKRIIGVARFSDHNLQKNLQAAGVETIAMDLLEPNVLHRLPDVQNVVFMAAKKFGTSSAEHETWAMNTYLPGRVAERFRESRIVAFSTGNVYPLRPVSHGGATEDTPVSPIGEYAQSALGRERMFEHASARWGTQVAILRLNYAVELRYGVLVDIGRAVYERRPVDLRMGLVNVIWQRDANAVCLRSLAYCDSPPAIFNVAGPETLSVRYIAERFGKKLGIQPVFSGEESDSALLNNAAKAHQLFGYPSVTPGEIIDWSAEWIADKKPLLNKPTHFETRDGKF
jgi:nucleoside-diphosphate-sugar epimerase